MSGRRALSTVTALLAWGGAVAVFAHGGGPALIFWGNFGTPAAECQRAIGLATRQCVARVWQARLACFRQGREGAPCPQATLDQALQSGRQRARDIIQKVCTDQEARLLQFASLAEVLIDAREGCRELDTAFDSATFGPVRRSDLTDEDLACVDRAANAVTSVERGALASRARILDRIAAFDMSIAEKNRLVALSDAQIAAAGAAGAVLGAEFCTDSDFERVYGRASGDFMQTITSRADCFSGRCYAQATLVCPPPDCGNGMQEPGETCDDGNRAGGDACPAGCGIPTPVPTVTPTPQGAVPNSGLSPASRRP